MVCKSDASQCIAVLSPSQSCSHGLWFASLMLHSALLFCHPPNLARRLPKHRQKHSLARAPRRESCGVREPKEVLRNAEREAFDVCMLEAGDKQGPEHLPHDGPASRVAHPWLTEAYRESGTFPPIQDQQTLSPCPPRTNKSRQKRRPPAVTLPILLSWNMVCKSDASQCVAVRSPSQSCWIC